MPQKLESPHEFPKIGAPAKRALVNAGYTHLEAFANVSETDLSKLHGMGPKAIKLLREALEELGLSFANRSGSRREDVISSVFGHGQSQDGQDAR